MSTNYRPLGVWLLRGCSLVLLAAAIVGCAGGKKAGTVTGKVTYKNEPVPGGFIKFHPSGGGNPVEGAINGEGYFNVPNVPLGEAKVTVDNSKLQMMPPGGGMPSTGPAGPPKDMKMPKDVNVPGVDPDKIKAMQEERGKSAKPVQYKPIPAKYANVSSTTLSIKVQKGENKQDFELTD